MSTIKTNHPSKQIIHHNKSSITTNHPSQQIIHHNMPIMSINHVNQSLSINHVNHPITVSKMSEGIKIHLLNILKSQGLSFKAGQLPFLDYGGKELTLIPSTLSSFRWNFRFLPIILPHVPDPRTCRVKDPQTVKVHSILPRMSCKIDNVGYVAPRSSEFSEPTTRILENTAISISVTQSSYRLRDDDK